jgi:hypothetical protein
MVSTNVDRDGREFVSTIDGIEYPVYGVQVCFVDGVLTTTKISRFRSGILSGHSMNGSLE